MLARAKVNLALHVVGRREDGLHLLDSLVVFPDLGDRLEAEPAATLSLTLDGPFGQDLGGGADNLVLKAAGLLRSAGLGAALRLTKNLPIASGIGGGSSDAAATLRLLAELWDVPLPSRDALVKLGADIPVCMSGTPARMQGVGEDITPLPDLPDFGIVLINRLRPVPTAAVFSGLNRTVNTPLPPLPTQFDTPSDLFGFLRNARNDLEPAALAVDPRIQSILDVLTSMPDCALARMSGSGGTCFGLFEDRDRAETAASAVRRHHPDWWISAGVVG